VLVGLSEIVALAGAVRVGVGVPVGDAELEVLGVWEGVPLLLLVSLIVGVWLGVLLGVSLEVGV
jgi:hypothetical protein